MKTATQPQQTQAELKVDHFEEGRCWITENGEPIAKIVPDKKEGEIARRIVKAVNMHSELIDAARTTILYLDMKGQKEIELFGQEKYWRLKQIIQ